MAAATVSHRLMSVQGPYRQEILKLTGVNDGDTVVARMQRPLFGFAVMTSDASPMTAAINPAISGRTVTLNSVDLAGSNDDVVLVLFGY